MATKEDSRLDSPSITTQPLPPPLLEVQGKHRTSTENVNQQNVTDTADYKAPTPTSTHSYTVQGSNEKTEHGGGGKATTISTLSSELKVTESVSGGGFSSPKQQQAVVLSTVTESTTTGALLTTSKVKTSTYQQAAATTAVSSTGEEEENTSGSVFVSPGYTTLTTTVTERTTQGTTTEIINHGIQSTSDVTTTRHSIEEQEVDTTVDKTVTNNSLLVTSSPSLHVDKTSAGDTEQEATLLDKDSVTMLQTTQDIVSIKDDAELTKPTVFVDSDRPREGEKPGPTSFATEISSAPTSDEVKTTSLNRIFEGTTTHRMDTTAQNMASSNKSDITTSSVFFPDGSSDSDITTVSLMESEITSKLTSSEDTTQGMINIEEETDMPSTPDVNIPARKTSTSKTPQLTSDSTARAISADGGRSEELTTIEQRGAVTTAADRDYTSAAATTEAVILLPITPRKPIPTPFITHRISVTPSSSTPDISSSSSPTSSSMSTTQIQTILTPGVTKLWTDPVILPRTTTFPIPGTTLPSTVPGTTFPVVKPDGTTPVSKPDGTTPISKPDGSSPVIVPTSTLPSYHTPRQTTVPNVPANNVTVNVATTPIHPQTSVPANIPTTPVTVPTTPGVPGQPMSTTKVQPPITTDPVKGTTPVTPVQTPTFPVKTHPSTPEHTTPQLPAQREPTTPTSIPSSPSPSSHKGLYLPTTGSTLLASLGTTTLVNSSIAVVPEGEISGFPLWIILICIIVAVAALAIICLIVFCCIICKKKKRGFGDIDKTNGDLWASTSHNYVSAMNEYTYVDMGTLSSQSTMQKSFPEGSEALQMETAFNASFNYDVIEDDTAEKWKNIFLSDSKEKLDTTGLAANTDLDNVDYAQGISTFRSPSKKSAASSTPIKSKDSTSQHSQDSKRADPSTHEYAVPVITPKQSASSSFDSLHVPQVEDEPLRDISEMNFPAITPPASIKPLLKSNKAKNSPAKRSSMQPSTERKRKKETGENPDDYLPVTVIYNKNSRDQLI